MARMAEYVSASSLLNKIQGYYDYDEEEDEFDFVEEIEQSDFEEDEEETLPKGKKTKQQVQEEKYDVLLTYCKKRDDVPVISNIECPICFSPATVAVCLPYCKHSYCRACFREYLKTQVGDVSKLQHNVVTVHQRSTYEAEVDILHYGIKCPDPSCRFVLSAPQIKSVATASVYTKFTTIVNTLELETNNPGFDYCPHCGKFAVPALLDGKYPYQKCTGCGIGHCKDCGRNVHVNKTCKQAGHVYKRHQRAMKLAAVPRHLRPLFADPTFFENAFQDWMKRTLTVLSRCPHCQTMIEKNGGCPNMHCTRCNRPFNWIEAQKKPVPISSGISPHLRVLYDKWLNYRKK